MNKIMFIIGIILLIAGYAYSGDIILDIYCSDAAEGFIYIAIDCNYDNPYVNYEDHIYSAGQNHIVYHNAIPNDGQTHTVYFNFNAWTSWGAGWTEDNEQNVEPNQNYTYFCQIDFWHPTPMTIFVNSNLDSDNATLRLYNQHDNLLKEENITLQANQTTEVTFNDVVPYGGGYFPPNPEEYENCYAEVTGFSQYGQILTEQTINNFTYNEQTEQYENSDINMLFDFYHNFKIYVQTNVNISNASFSLKTPNGNTISTQTVNLIGNHLYSANFDYILNPQGTYNPAEYKLYYQGTSIVGETKIEQNTNNLTYDENGNFWYNNTYMVNYLQDSETKSVHNGWNWVSFPRLIDNTQNTEWVLDPTTPYINQIIYIPRDFILEYDYQNLQWGPIVSLGDLRRTAGYKLQMGNYYPDYNFTVLGDIENSSTTILLSGGSYENWIGYWIPETQNWRDAIPENQLAHITSIKAEDWYLYQKHGQWYGMNGATFEYGKAYVITVDENFWFHWQHLGSSEPYVREKAELFTYEEKSDYQMIEIESIEDGDNVQEVGVFQGDVCVGASKVDGYPIHLMAYTNQYDKEDELSFEIVTSDKSKKIYKTVLSYNFDKQAYEPANLHANKSEFMLIRLDKNGNVDVPAENNISLTNYPNPFNPTTTISYQIPQKSSITLCIYDLKGQLVKTLYKGIQDKGKYTVDWNGTNNNNIKISSGMYFYKLETPYKVITKKMLLLK